VNFQFHPEYASEANNLIAGFVPFLKDCGHSFHLKMFTPEALQRQARARWNLATREADSKTDAELAKLLAEDDELNFTDEPTLENPEFTSPQDSQQNVSINIPSLPIEHIPSMRQDDDLISTFHPGKLGQIIEENDPEEDMVPPTATHTSPVGILRTPRASDHNAVSRISMSDSASRISSLETELSAMNQAFQGAVDQLKSQAAAQASAHDL
jgi:hypothetical protein